MRESAGKSGLKQCCGFSGSCSANRQEGQEGRQGSDRSGEAIKVSGFFLAERERLLHSLKQNFAFWKFSDVWILSDSMDRKSRKNAKSGTC